MKKILSAFILFTFAFSVLPFSFFANARSHSKLSKNKEYYYRVIENEFIEITAPNLVNVDNSSELILPSKIDGYTVTSIGDRAFCFWEFLPEKVVLPDTVTYIGDSAFEYKNDLEFMEFSSLTTVVLPSGITHIGNKAFKGNINLENVEIPKGIVYIGIEAFADCDNLNEMVIPGTIRYLGNRAFANCNSLTKVVINEGIRELPNKIFYNCTNLKKITMNDDVSIKGNKALGYYYDKKMKKDRIQQNLKVHFVESTAKLSQWNSVITYAQNIGLSYCFFLNAKSNTKLESEAGLSFKLRLKNKKVLSWSSSNTNVIKITSTGNIATLSKGTSILKANLSDGTTYSRKFKVTNSPRVRTLQRWSVSNVSLKKGETKEFFVVFKVPNIKNTYTNTKIAKITGKKNSNTFKIKGLKKGTTTLKVKVNGVKTLKLKVKVK